jgi:hypothetical protein
MHRISTPFLMRKPRKKSSGGAAAANQRMCIHDPPFASLDLDIIRFSAALARSATHSPKRTLRLPGSAAAAAIARIPDFLVLAGVITFLSFRA